MQRNHNKKREFRILVVENDKVIIPIIKKLLFAALQVQKDQCLSFSEENLLTQAAYPEIDIYFQHTNLAQTSVDLVEEKLKASGKSFDLIIMDNKLDDSMRGSEATSRIRQIELNYHQETVNSNKDALCFPDLQEAWILTFSSDVEYKDAHYPGANGSLGKQPIKAQQVKEILKERIKFAILDDTLRRKASAPEVLHHSTSQLICRARNRDSDIAKRTLSDSSDSFSRATDSQDIVRNGRHSFLWAQPAAVPLDLPLGIPLEVSPDALIEHSIQNDFIPTFKGK